MENAKNQTNKVKKFFSDKKNTAIVILSFLLLSYFCAYNSKSNTNINFSEYETQINELNTKATQLQDKINTLQAENTALKDEKSKLEETNRTLEEQKNTLENEKNELNKKITELSSVKNAEPSAISSSNSNVQTSQATSITSNSKSTSTSSSTSNSQMVWVGETGNKYHTQSCRTLKGKGHQITMQQALAEGRTACKVCH